MATELIVNASLPETRIALLENGEIQELLIERASGKGIVGNIYKGRVTRVLPGMQAAFVDIGLEKAAFLYVDDVYVHPELFEDEEGEVTSEVIPVVAATEETKKTEEESVQPIEVASEASSQEGEVVQPESTAAESEDQSNVDDADGIDDEEDADDDDDDTKPVSMGRDPNSEDDDQGRSEEVEGTIRPQENSSAHDTDDSVGNRVEPSEVGPGIPEEVSDQTPQTLDETGSVTVSDNVSAEPGQESRVSDQGRRQVFRRGRRGGRNRRRPSEHGQRSPDRYSQAGGHESRQGEYRGRSSRDRRIRPKTVRSIRGQVNIQDLLKEGQEVLVQVAKDPIAAKGARLTCHISLPGRHLVCMPTIDHVGVSRRIEKDDERRRLRDFVDRNRPENLGFIVRTASGKIHSEKRIKQDIEYLSRLWDEIKNKAANLSAPALVYEDLNSVLRAIRDWVTEDIDKIIVDSRYYYNDVLRFASHFMPSLKQKVELYHGDIPIFDAYNISTELSRALERKVWLKSGGYIVIDQTEALVAIDVNTGRYVGKKNLEDTILKTNLEAVQEIAYQLRLRNSGGIIILDLIDMEKEENKLRVYRALDEALKRDRARPTILKISELGLVEMTRKRTRDTIIRTLCEPCSHCEGKGFIKSKQTVAYEVLREIEREGLERGVPKILAQAHPDVIDILAIDERETLDQLERRYRKLIYLQAAPDFHPEQFEVVGDRGTRPELRDDKIKPVERQGIIAPRVDESVSMEEERAEPSETDVEEAEMSPEGLASEAQEDEIAEEEHKAFHDNLEGRHVEEVAEDEVAEQIVEAPIDGTMSEDELSGSGVEREGVEGKRPIIANGDDGFDNEEDRLAFLRAQAAQDAALAGMTSATRTSAVPRNQNSYGKGPRGGRGGRGRWNKSGGGGGRRTPGRRYRSDSRSYGSKFPSSSGPTPVIKASDRGGESGGGESGGESGEGST